MQTGQTGSAGSPGYLHRATMAMGTSVPTQTLVFPPVYDAGSSCQNASKYCAEVTRGPHPSMPLPLPVPLPLLVPLLPSPMGAHVLQPRWR